MNKILISLSVIGVVAAIAVGGTMAYFSDTETSTGNTFTAGTLDLKVDGADNPLPVKFTLGNLKPGDTGTVTYVLNNAGTIDGFIDIESVVVTNTEGTNPEPETDTTEPGDLGGLLQVDVKIDGVSQYAGALDGFVGNHDYSVALAAGASANVDIEYSWPSGANDNDAQGDVSTVDLSFELGQTAAQ